MSTISDQEAYQTLNRLGITFYGFSYRQIYKDRTIDGAVRLLVELGIDLFPTTVERKSFNQPYGSEAEVDKAVMDFGQWAAANGDQPTLHACYVVFHLLERSKQQQLGTQRTVQGCADGAEADRREAIGGPTMTGELNGFKSDPVTLRIHEKLLEVPNVKTVTVGLDEEKKSVVFHVVANRNRGILAVVTAVSITEIYREPFNSTLLATHVAGRVEQALRA